MRYITTLTSTTDLNTYIDNYNTDYFEYQMNNIFNNENNQFMNSITLLDENMINDSSNKFYYNLNRHQSKFSAIKLGDICYLDRNNEIYITDEILEKDEGYIPIAVCFIPSDFFFTSSPARFVSCYGYCRYTTTMLGIDTIGNSIYNTKQGGYYDHFKYNSTGESYNAADTNKQIKLPLIYVSSNKKINTDIDSVIDPDSNLFQEFYKQLSGHDYWYNVSISGSIPNLLNSLDSSTRYLCSNNEIVTYIQEVNDTNNLWIIPGYDYEDIMSVSANNGLSWFNNNTLIWDDSFGYEHMYDTYMTSILTSDLKTVYYSWRNNIIGAKELDNKVFWYIPAICELIFLRMHLGTIKDICYNIQKEYNFYHYDMFNINIDIYSSTCLYPIMGESRGIFFYIDKYGILKHLNKSYPFNALTTYPVFQL